MPQWTDSRAARSPGRAASTSKRFGTTSGAGCSPSRPAHRLATARSGPTPYAGCASSLTGHLNEIFELTLEAEPGVTDLMTLRDLAEFEVKNRLLAVPRRRRRRAPGRLPAAVPARTARRAPS